MAAMGIDIAAYKEVLLILGTAGVVVPVFHRLKINPVFGFILSGALLGPDGLGALAKHWPWLASVTVDERGKIAHVAEFGVVLLLFMIGLELSFERLRTMKRMVFGLGGLQVLLSLSAIGLVAFAFGLSAVSAVVIGSCLALSSTALVIQELANQKRLATPVGRTAFSVLLFQDIAVVPILMLVGILAAGSTVSLGASLGLTAIKALFAIGAIVLVGRFVLRPLFRSVARTHSAELFMAASLLVIIATSLVAAASGLSMALGAFMAGLVLAETEYRRALEVTIEPFKGLLLGVFFFSVGMSLDLNDFMAMPGSILGGVIALIVIKAGLVMVLAFAFGLPRAVGIECAFLLAPAGEFAFVVIGQALGLGVLDAQSARLGLAVASLSMIILPVVGWLGLRLAKRSIPTLTHPALSEKPEPEAQTGHVVIAGFGRVGRLVAAILEEHRVPYLAIDGDVDQVIAARAAGKPVFYGDAARSDFLKSCGIMAAKAVAVTMDNRAAVESVVAAARALRPNVVLVARAKDRAHARSLYELGVTEAVPEAFEASLHLAEATLIGSGVPLGLAIASVHEQRDRFRAEFQRIDRGDIRTDAARLRAKREGRTPAAADGPTTERPA